MKKKQNQGEIKGKNDNKKKRKGEGREDINEAPHAGKYLPIKR